VKISSQDITNIVAGLFIDANCHIQEEVYDAWIRVLKEEEVDSQAEEVIKVMIKNACIAWEEDMPICQDTGQAVVVVEQGEEVKITGKPLVEAINDGIEKGGKEGCLRKSVILDPLDRNNEGSYGPAIIHHNMAPGETLKITVYPAGCGCEQMNCAAMFPPSDEEKTIIEFVLQKVKESASKPCPPNIIGLGIGGDLEQSSYLARMALLRPINKRNEKYKDLEKRLLKEINRLNIGPQGLGGKTTVLAVNIEAASCHRANLPIAIAFNCHVGRCKTWTYGEENKGEKEEGFLIRLKESAKNIKIFTDYKKVQLPLSGKIISSLKAGDKVLLNGFVYTARDAAHKRLVNLLKEKKDLPFDLKGQVIYYVGPTPPRPGRVIGSAGPTTSYRMDIYTPLLLSHGLKGMIGKGYRSQEVIDVIKRYKAIYFFTFAGAGALLSGHIVNSEIIAFEDLGTEAIRKLELRDFPAIVACDSEGRDIYTSQKSFAQN
jgi:tartrate/fumarate subfamily iron-sulfur-dependent hydro-lyase alpha chain/tartrate/fumarate subfamily iron-sulfur-dependent hydro-lyase beta chain